MAAKKHARTKKYFTVALANATLPLVRSIVRDISELAHHLRDRYERLARVQAAASRGKSSAAHDEELQQVQADFQHDQERMQEYEKELHSLGIELKDYFTGLIDFPCWMDGREVYLCWKMGEPEVAHWHELDAGFAGRKKLPKGETSSPKSEVVK